MTRYCDWVLYVLAALALGALLALCGLPFEWSYLTPLPLAALFAFTAAAPTVRAGAARMFWAGLAFFTLTLYWLPDSFGGQGGFGWFGVAMFVPLFALEAFFWTTLAWACLMATRHFEARVLLLAFGWVLLEWLRHLGQIAFPWGTVGYTLLPLPVVQVADLGGVLLLSLIVTFTSAGLALAIRGRYRPLVVALGVWGLGTAYGLTRPEVEGEEGRALLVRTDFDSHAKAAGVDGFLQANLRLSSRAREGEVPMWSETTIFAFPDGSLPGEVLPARLLTGVSFPGVGADGSPRNSAVAWNGSVAARFDKMQLVPFGEYYPFKRELRGAYEWIFDRVVRIPFGPPEPGERAVPLPLDGRLYGAYICYDSVFSRVTAELVRNGAQVLVNLSNDGWYGESVGVEQHFQMGRVRAIETRRYVLRSVNRGVAAVIDERGRVLQRFSGPGEDVVHARFRFLEGETVFVRFGHAPVLVLCALGLMWGVWLDRRRRRLDW